MSHVEFHAPRPVAPRPSPLKSSPLRASSNSSSSSSRSVHSSATRAERPSFFRSASTGSMKRVDVPTCLHRLRNSQNVAMHAEEELESILFAAGHASAASLHHPHHLHHHHHTQHVTSRPGTPSPRSERKLGLQLLPSGGEEGGSSSSPPREPQHWRASRNDFGAKTLSSPLFHVYTPPISRASNPIVSDNHFHAAVERNVPPRGAELGLLSRMEAGLTLMGLDGREASVQITHYTNNKNKTTTTTSTEEEARHRVSRTSAILKPEHSFHSFLRGQDYRYREGAPRGHFPYVVGDFHLAGNDGDDHSQHRGSASTNNNSNKNEDPRATQTNRELLKQPPALRECSLVADDDSVGAALRGDPMALDEEQIAVPVYVPPVLLQLGENDGGGRHQRQQDASSSLVGAGGDPLDDILNYRVENVVTLPTVEPHAGPIDDEDDVVVIPEDSEMMRIQRREEERQRYEEERFPVQMDVDEDDEYGEGRRARREEEEEEHAAATAALAAVDPMELRLEIRGLPRGAAKRSAIVAHFSKFNVVDCWDLRGTWLIQFETISDKDKARRSLDGSKIAYRKIRLVRATHKPPATASMALSATSGSSLLSSSSSLFHHQSSAAGLGAMQPPMWDEREVAHEARSLLRNLVAQEVVKRMMQGKGMQVLKEKVRAWERGCAEAAATLANSVVVERRKKENVGSVGADQTAGGTTTKASSSGDLFAELGSFKKLQHLKAKADLKRKRKNHDKRRGSRYDEEEDEIDLHDVGDDDDLVREEKRSRVTAAAYHQPWGLDIEEGDPADLTPGALLASTIDENQLDWEDVQRLKRWRVENGLPDSENRLDTVRQHSSGSVRFWPVPSVKNAPKMLQHTHLLAKQTARTEQAQVADIAQTVGSRRSRRADQRSMQLAMSDMEGNLLQGREKKLKFQRSGIHGWGLYAQERINPREFIIEYIGEIVRERVADKREKGYEKLGIGSSYMFRIDADTVVDATERGNVARFTNHSCDPNCYAQVIKVKGEPKIVFYALRSIAVGEELTYDYCFASEIEKIPCHCGAATCKGSLN